jgi:hypothetical protein
LANNPDVDPAKVDFRLHHLQSGGFEGRDPGSTFSSKFTWKDMQMFVKPG